MTADKSNFESIYIPPYEEIFANGSFNSNLHWNSSAYVSSEVTSDLGITTSDIERDDIFYGGANDHGWGTSGATTDIPYSGITPHAETPSTSSVYYHHGVGNTYDKVYPGGTGSYTNYTNGQGTPWHTSQGTQALWNTFFSDYYLVTELEWTTESYFYNYIYGVFLRDFLGTFFDYNKVFQTSNIEAFYQITTETNRDTQISYLYLIDDGQDSLIDLFPNIQAVIFEQEFIDMLNNIMTEYQASDYYVAPVSGEAPNSYPGFQEWYFDDWYSSDSSSLIDAWNVFLTSSDINRRFNASFLWSFDQMVDMIDAISNIALSQSNRMQIYLNAEDAAISDMSAVVFSSVSSDCDVTSIDYNNKANSWISIYKSRYSTASNYVGQQSTTVNTSYGAINDQTSTIDDILNNMEGILQFIFNR
jgi:hypothetical protein